MTDSATPHTRSPSPTPAPTLWEKDHLESSNSPRIEPVPVTESTAHPRNSFGRRGSEATAVEHYQSSQSPRRPWRRPDGWSGWLGEDISTTGLIPVLLVQAFGVGLLDAGTYLDYLTFTSNQTGTTALLLISASSKIPQSALLVGVSLIGYVLGAGVFGQLGNLTGGGKRRIFLLTCNSVHLALMAVAVILNSPVAPAVTLDGGRHQWLPLFLYALMSGGQVAAARQSGCAEISVGPITTTWVDLAIDPDLLRSSRDPRVAGRNRRAGYIACLAVGAGLGGVIYQWGGGGWVVGLVVMAVKLLAMCLIICSRGETR